ncbi:MULTISPECIES: YqhA family protein [Ramlibacter]|uniref:YqhA family protein n=1 Tax=Ramlibacter pinisoli TaxID=2682844 RepID=A0A6N8IYE8_9BURK|nr:MULTISPECIES: YqhA family protein [Ramlibacter]MBA2961069.1 YqhA family protein [Ramlibacter sp. CGMCC 1.13660]MVQ31013.1 YqhA family protein [Ramlibacter pinisoli]
MDPSSTLPEPPHAVPPATSVLGRALAGCRFLLLGAVVGSIILEAGLVAAGISMLLRSLACVGSCDAKELALVAIQALDLFLLATVAWLTASGLYTLFIDPSARTWLRAGVESLDDLKAKLIGVVVLALGVLFLGETFGWSAGPDLLYYGVAIAAVILSLSVFIRTQK